MQVVILYGEQGTRIRHVSEDIPKPMIPIGDRPILWHIMKNYAQHRYNEFILCLGHKSSVIRRYFLDYYLNQSNFTPEVRGETVHEINHQYLSAEKGSETSTWECVHDRVAQGHTQNAPSN